MNFIGRLLKTCAAEGMGSEIEVVSMMVRRQKERQKAKSNGSLAELLVLRGCVHLLFRMTKKEKTTTK
jgi:hypothetical protein